MIGENNFVGKEERTAEIYTQKNRILPLCFEKGTLVPINAIIRRSSFCDRAIDIVLSSSTMFARTNASSSCSLLPRARAKKHGAHPRAVSTRANRYSNIVTLSGILYVGYPFTSVKNIQAPGSSWEGIGANGHPNLRFTPISRYVHTCSHTCARRPLEEWWSQSARLLFSRFWYPSCTARSGLLLNKRVGNAGRCARDQRNIIAVSKRWYTVTPHKRQLVKLNSPDAAFDFRCATPVT